MEYSILSTKIAPEDCAIFRLPPELPYPINPSQGDAMGEHARLARAGTGEDEQRPFGGRDGASLLRVEAADDALRERLWSQQLAGRRYGRARRTLPADACHGREPGRLLRVRTYWVDRLGGALAGPAASRSRIGRLLRCLIGVRVRQRLRRWRQLGPVERILMWVSHRPMLARMSCHLDRRA